MSKLHHKAKRGDPKVWVAKKDLQDGVLYWGTCRNSDHAFWDKKKNCFWHFDSRFGHRDELPHPEDDDGSDLFFPFGVVDE